MGVKIKRIYEPPSPDDGYRVLVDRLWPRGVSRERAKLDAWMKDLAPSTELRLWFQHDPSKWDEFKRRYQEELAQPDRIRLEDSSQPDKTRLIEELVLRAHKGTVTLLYAARDEEHNEAVVLKEVLDRILARAERHTA